jgi:hypothetical protein
MLPYLACYMGHADLRGTQYYLRLTADAYPEVMARVQVRFGYVIPGTRGRAVNPRPRRRRILPGAGCRSSSPTTWPGSAQPRPKPSPPTGTR